MLSQNVRLYMLNETASIQKCCPLEGYFLKKCMVYEAKVSTENYFKLYYGTCEEEFKFCFYNHTKSFRDRGNETKPLK